MAAIAAAEVATQVVGSEIKSQGLETASELGASQAPNAGNLQAPTSGSGAWGAAGGLVDSLGMSVTGWIDRAERRRMNALQQANFDKQFDQNVKQWGLQFALQEWATRKGISMQEAQAQYNRTTGSMSLADQLKVSQLNRQSAQVDLENKKRQQRLGRLFAKGFAEGARSKAGK